MKKVYRSAQFERVVGGVRSTITEPLPFEIDAEMMVDGQIECEDMERQLLEWSDGLHPRSDNWQMVSLGADYRAS